MCDLCLQTTAAPTPPPSTLKPSVQTVLPLFASRCYLQGLRLLHLALQPAPDLPLHRLPCLKPVNGPESIRQLRFLVITSSVPPSPMVLARSRCANLACL